MTIFEQQQQHQEEQAVAATAAVGSSNRIDFHGMVFVLLAHYYGVG